MAKKIKHGSTKLTTGGFSLVELLVAIGALGALLAASGMIFSVAVRSQRTAAASAEITRKLQAVTDAISADFFLGLRKDEPVMVWFERDAATGERFDQMMFFANGNYYSTRQYDWYNATTTSSGRDTVSGNLARVYYGHANSAVITTDPVTGEITNRTIAIPADYTSYKTMTRRIHIVPASPIFEPYLDGSDSTYRLFPDVSDFVNSFVPISNDYYEYDQIALSEWRNVFDYLDGSFYPVNSEHIIETCFDNTAGRCGIDLTAPESLHNLLCQGVGSFTIQWAYEVSGQLQWFPGDNPVTGNPDFEDTDLDTDGDGAFGVYFNMPNGVNVNTTGVGDNDWSSPAEITSRYGIIPPPEWVVTFPQAFKFTFTLYDSRGIFKEGKKFTQIIYVNP